jgi:phage terminase large subunit GpA-like protein
MESRLYQELTAEARGKSGWVNTGKRKNETLDLCVYGEALVLYMRADKINWANPPSWAAEWDKNPDLIQEGGAPVLIQKRKLRVARSTYMERR